MKFSTLENILRKNMKSKRAAKGVSFAALVEIHKLRTLWPQLVGEAFAKNSYVSQLRSDKLIVRCAHSSMLFELRQRKFDLLKSLKKHSSAKIKDLLFETGPMPENLDSKPVTQQAAPKRRSTTQLPLERMQQEVKYLPKWLLDTMQRIQRKHGNND